ncbi:hypothetical protein GCM10010910_03940 [Microbacterium nanhaiense]|uniref:Abortive infection protein-like C-terminal domain-containing protein n=2 Tax=Microbacterium nanhaiense TaxID=1301026 RepID=A0ABQ2MXY9_9MICO|nr:hypothetical protein GCM10010910_03940 [Microbacterium nanhaiense]
MPHSSKRITAITRRKLVDSISLSGLSWSGRLDEPSFLGRIYDLSALPSTDTRYRDAAGDIWQHRVNNPYDWEDDWVFTDSRFGLMHGDDEVLLVFLAEMLHPVVRTDETETALYLKAFNDALSRDGYELYASDWISGHAIYGWRRLDAFHGTSPELRLSERPLTDPDVLQEHLNRIRAGLVSDPPAAISSCKNLIESLFKIILDRSDVEYSHSADVPELYRKVADLLALNAEAVPESVRASQTSQRILRTLVTTINSLSELRNALGIGHGQSRRSEALARHARLALNATVTVAEFVLDTWQVRLESGALEIGDPQ